MCLEVLENNTPSWVVHHKVIDDEERTVAARTTYVQHTLHIIPYFSYIYGQCMAQKRFFCPVNCCCCCCCCLQTMQMLLLWLFSLSCSLSSSSCTTTVPLTAEFSNTTTTNDQPSVADQQLNNNPRARDYVPPQQNNFFISHRSVGIVYYSPAVVEFRVLCTRHTSIRTMYLLHFRMAALPDPQIFARAYHARTNGSFILLHPLSLFVIYQACVESAGAQQQFRLLLQLQSSVRTNCMPCRVHHSTTTHRRTSLIHLKFTYIVYFQLFGSCEQSKGGVRVHYCGAVQEVRFRERRTFVRMLVRSLYLRGAVRNLLYVVQYLLLYVLCNVRVCG